MGMQAFLTKQHQIQEQTYLNCNDCLGRPATTEVMRQSPHTTPNNFDAYSNVNSINHFAHDFSRMPVHNSSQLTLQPKLTVNTEGDIYEKEADRVANQVIDAEVPDLQHQKVSPGGSTASVAAPPIVQEVLGAPGQPLGTGTRQFMESRFGHDFSQVRLHTDARAAESAKAVNALAYTVGQDVVFAAGRYSPEAAGQRLLAHELTHVVQQQGRGEPSVQRQTPSSTATPEADKKESSASAASTSSPAFDMPWQAALEALTICNPQSILSMNLPGQVWGIEYGGLIYKMSGKYYYTPPIKGSEEKASVEVWDALSLVPEEAKRSIVGDYHTHGGPRLPGTGEDFSGFREKPIREADKDKGDIAGIIKDSKTRKEVLDPQKYTAFLATPTGRFTIFIPAQNLIFSFSPNPRLLPPDSKIAAAGYAH
jgi:hypothetical protein